MDSVGEVESRKPHKYAKVANVGLS